MLQFNTLPLVLAKLATTILMAIGSAANYDNSDGNRQCCQLWQFWWQSAVLPTTTTLMAIGSAAKYDNSDGKAVLPIRTILMAVSSAANYYNSDDNQQCCQLLKLRWNQQCCQLRQPWWQSAVLPTTTTLMAISSAANYDNWQLCYWYHSNTRYDIDIIAISQEMILLWYCYDCRFETILFFPQDMIQDIIYISYIGI